MDAEADWTFVYCRGRQLITKNQEIEDITIEKYGCQIKISYDRIDVSFIDLTIKLYFMTPEILFGLMPHEIRRIGKTRAGRKTDADI